MSSQRIEDLISQSDSKRIEPAASVGVKESTAPVSAPIPAQSAPLDPTNLARLIADLSNFTFDKTWVDTRISAANELGKTGEARAAKPLADAINNIGQNLMNAYDLKRLRQSYSNALVQLGAPGVEQLLLALSIPDPYQSPTRYEAASSALQRFADARATGPLIAAIETKKTKEGLTLDVILLAIHILGTIGDKAATPTLIKALRDPQESICRNAAKALGEIGDAQAVEPLLATLNRGAWITLEVAKALYKFDHQMYNQPIINAVQIAAKSGEKYLADHAKSILRQIENGAENLD
jgi:HEAT repeat protein